MLTFIVIVMVVYVVGSKVTTTVARNPETSAGIGRLFLGFFKK